VSIAGNESDGGQWWQIYCKVLDSSGPAGPGKAAQHIGHSSSAGLLKQSSSSSSSSSATGIRGAVLGPARMSDGHSAHSIISVQSADTKSATASITGSDPSTKKPSVDDGDVNSSGYATCGLAVQVSEVAGQVSKIALSP
jgi:hypothetical protein